MLSKRLIYIIIGITFVLTASAKITYRTAELHRLATVLSIEEATLSEGYNYQTRDHRQIVIAVRNQTVHHIGLHLFNEDMRDDHAPVFDFLERYFLQLKYPPMSKSAQKMMRDDQFLFIIGSANTIDALSPNDNFGFSYDKNLYVAKWSRSDQVLLSVSFPVEYELISGENKIEAENNLMTDVKAVKVSNVKPRVSGGVHYINERFTSRLYYQGKKLLFDEHHPAETVANLLQSVDMDGVYYVKMTQVSYGFRKTTFEIPLHQWIAFCYQSGCQLYVGIENIGNNGDVSAVVIAVNESENYNHVLTISVPYDSICDKKGSLEARLYPYVPTHNVRNLFATYGKSSPKTVVRQ